MTLSELKTHKKLAESKLEREKNALETQRRLAAEGKPNVVADQYRILAEAELNVRLWQDEIDKIEDKERQVLFDLHENMKSEKDKKSMEENMIYILTQLKEKRANIQPINVNDFYYNLNISAEDAKPCWGILEEEKLIKIETTVKTTGFYLVWITDKGMLWLDNKKVKSKEANTIIHQTIIHGDVIHGGNDSIVNKGKKATINKEVQDSFKDSGNTTKTSKNENSSIRFWLITLVVGVLTGVIVNFMPKKDDAKNITEVKISNPIKNTTGYAIGKKIKPIIVSEFKGHIGRWQATFNLTFDYKSEKIYGTYYYPKRKGIVYRITGIINEDNIELTEYTDDKITATCKLTTTDERCFIGKMYNTDNRKLEMNFCNINK